MNEKKNNKQKILDYISFEKIISFMEFVDFHLNHFWNFNKKKRWNIENIYEIVFYHSVVYFILYIA